MNVCHPWLGQVSSGTRIGRLKFGLANLVAGGTPDTGNPEFWSDEGTPWVAISDMSTSDAVFQTAKRVTDAGLADKRLDPLQAGVLLYSMYASLGHVAELCVNAVTNQAILGLSFDSSVVPRYAFWQLKALQPYVIESASSNTQDNLNAEKVRNLPFAFPPRSEQSRIANFLDEKTARIDALIAEKDELIVCLVEFGHSVIASRILGEDIPGSRHRTNVVEVGSIPAGWQLVPMMRLTDPRRPIMYGIVLPGPNIDEGPSVPILKGGDVRPHRLKLELLNRTTPEIEAPYARARLAEGDIVYSIRGTIGDAELVPTELAGANITQDVARIAPREGIEPRWLLYAAKSRPVFAQLDQLSLGAAVRGINIFDIKRARVPTPPLDAQHRIADELDAITGRLSALREHTLQHIARLREYRSSLISAAVTGQIDIGNYKGAA